MISCTQEPPTELEDQEEPVLANYWINPRGKTEPINSYYIEDVEWSDIRADDPQAAVDVIRAPLDTSAEWNYGAPSDEDKLKEILSMLQYAMSQGAPSHMQPLPSPPPVQQQQQQQQQVPPPTPEPILEDFLRAYKTTFYVTSLNPRYTYQLLQKSDGSGDIVLQPVRKDGTFVTSATARSITIPTRREPSLLTSSV